jgi:hypothetical protein
VKATLEETWTYTENIETISEPPPEALVVDAGPPVTATRTVPILTTFDQEPHLGGNQSDSPAHSLGSTRAIAGDGARIISVLTPNGAASPGDMQLHSDDSSESGSGDRYQSSAS